MASIELQQDPERPFPPLDQLQVKRDNSDPYIVVFAEPFDQDNPIQWPDRRKWVVTNILSATGFNRIVVSTIMAPALPVIAAELNMTPTQSALSLSIYLLATAFGPIVIGPLSEIYGRQVVLHTSNIWFAAWNLACGFATTKEVLIVSRLFTGLGASAIYSLGGGVWVTFGHQSREETHADWRWMFWATSIFQAVSIVICFFTFHETSGAVILKRRAARLRRTTGNKQYMTLDERLDRDLPLATVLSRALARPLRLLAFDRIIQLTTVIEAVSYGLLLRACRLIDVYVESTSSALSANQFGRSLAAFSFPLFAPALYRSSLGYGWGNTTIAFVGAVTGIVPPFLLWKYGARLRAKTPALY